MAKFQFTEEEQGQILQMVLMSRQCTHIVESFPSVLKAGDESLEAFEFYYGYNLLQLAADRGDAAVTQILLQKGFDVKIKLGIMRGEDSLLHIAAQKGHAAVVEALLDHNANVNEPDMVGGTPIFRATKEGHLAIMKTLLDHNANLVTESPESVLHCAVRCRQSDAIVLLLSKGADANALSNFEWTPLQVAVVYYPYNRTQAINSIKALLTSEAPVIIKSDKEADCVIQTLIDNKGFVPTKFPVAASPEKQEAITSIIKATIEAAWLELNVMFNEMHLTPILRDFYGSEPHAPDSTSVTGDAMSD